MSTSEVWGGKGGGREEVAAVDLELPRLWSQEVNLYSCLVGWFMLVFLCQA